MTTPTVPRGMSAELPTLSVVIPARNSASTLTETLEAIAQQDYPAWWEVVVVENGSNDDTTLVAQGFETRLPNLSVLNHPAPAYAATAQNYGIAHSKGEVIVFLDADDVIGPDYLVHMGRALAGAPFTGAAMDVDRLNSVQVRQRRAPLQETGIATFCGFRPAVIGAAMGAQRDVVESVGGFDESLPTQQDIDLSWRLAEQGFDATFVPEATLHYRYRHNASDIFDQEYGYGTGEVALYRKFRDQGMPRRGPLRVLAAYARLAKALLLVWRPGGASRFATSLGMNAGRLRESLRRGTAYL